MDYRKLLLSYIIHVLHKEGMDFIDYGPFNEDELDWVFTSFDLVELEKLSRVAYEAKKTAEFAVSSVPPGEERVEAYVESLRQFIAKTYVTLDNHEAT